MSRHRSARLLLPTGFASPFGKLRGLAPTRPRLSTFARRESAVAACPVRPLAHTVAASFRSWLAATAGWIGACFAAVRSSSASVRERFVVLLPAVNTNGVLSASANTPRGTLLLLCSRELFACLEDSAPSALVACDVVPVVLQVLWLARHAAQGGQAASGESALG